MAFHHNLEYYRQRLHTVSPDVAAAITDLCDEIDRLRAELAAFRESLLVRLQCHHCGQKVCVTDDGGKLLREAACESCRAEHTVREAPGEAVVMFHYCDIDFCGYDGHDELGEP